MKRKDNNTVEFELTTSELDEAVWEYVLSRNPDLKGGTYEVSISCQDYGISSVSLTWNPSKKKSKK